MIYFIIMSVGLYLAWYNMIFIFSKFDGSYTPIVMFTGFGGIGMFTFAFIFFLESITYSSTSSNHKINKGIQSEEQECQ